MKKVLKGLLVGTMCAVSALSLYGCSGETTAEATAEGYVSLDVNANVEFFTDSNGTVLQVRGANQSANVLLTDMVLEDLPLDEAVEQVTEESEELGYLTEEEKEVTIIVASEEKETQETLEEMAQEGVENGSEIAEIQPEEATLTLAEEVEAYKAQDAETYAKLTVAKLKLAKSIMEYDRDFTVAMASSMKTSELVRKLHWCVKEYAHVQYQELRAEYEAKYLELSEEIYANIDAFYGEEYVRIQSLVRQLEVLEEKFERQFEQMEQTPVEPELPEETPAETPEETPTETPEETPTETPEETPTETPEETPVAPMGHNFAKHEDGWGFAGGFFHEGRFPFEKVDELTEDMLAELTALLGEHNITNMDELDDYIDGLEAQLWEIKRDVKLTEEQKAQIQEWMQELRELQKTACEQMKDIFDDVKEQYRNIKKQLKQKHGKK